MHNLRLSTENFKHSKVMALCCRKAFEMCECFKASLFSTNDEVKQVVLRWFNSCDKTCYAEAFHVLPKCWDKCIHVAGDYVGVGMQCSLLSVFVNSSPGLA